MIDDILDEAGPNGGQPTTPLGETQMTNSAEEDVDDVPYTSQNGVSWVADWGVHWYAQRTSKSSLAHLPLALCSCFFSFTIITLLVALAWPFA